MTSRAILALLCVSLGGCPIFGGGDEALAPDGEPEGGGSAPGGGGGGSDAAGAGGEGGAPFGAPPVDAFCEDVIRMATRDQPLVVATFGYDADGRLLRYGEADEDGVVSYELTRAYDAVGRRAAQEIWIHAGETRRSMTWSYDDDGRVVGTTYEEELGTGTTSQSSQYAYDEQGRYLSISSSRNGDLIAVSTYEWSDGEPVRLVTRDALDGPDGPSYESELIGGRWLGLTEHRTAGVLDSRSRFVYGAVGEVVRSEYDADGDGDIDQISVLDWSSAHQPIRYALDKGGDGTYELVELYQYDAGGRLIERDRTMYDATGELVIFRTITSAYWVEGRLHRVDVRDGQTLEAQRVWTFERGCDGDPSKDIRWGEVRAWRELFSLPLDSVDSSRWWGFPEIF